MNAMRRACEIVLDEQDRTTLEKWSKGRLTPSRLVTRANIVLLAAQGLENHAIAERLNIGRDTVATWRQRFSKYGLASIVKDAPRGGRKPTVRDDVTARIVEWTTQKKPANATHWSTRTLAKELDVSRSMVQRVWKAHGLKPHLMKTFKVSNDTQFVEKMQDIVGLYLNPPEHALVLCCDEKSQIQALDRTQPGLPMKKGRCGTMTHDYKRNGTTTLFAALELAEGRLIGTCMPRHRHQEWIKFLRQIDKETPPGLDLHLIVDNYATHKHPKVKAWLKRHRRFHIHFTPTSSSWLNLVERWFREITDKRIRRGVFKSVKELVATIMDYIQRHNADPQTFVWTAKADQILAKVSRARRRLDKMATA
jgi:transposase